MTAYEATIGLEIHVQLATRSKMFCGCAVDSDAPPNTRVCPVCLGYPGAMPTMNELAIRHTVMTGLMVGSRINRHSKFDRKSYFYPDMPKNYQISQYDRPLCEGGGVALGDAADGRTIRLRRIHLEEDVGKNMHFARSSAVDFNRAGVPLMEIVTEPDLRSADEAYAFLLALKELVTYAGVSECNLERGNLRCDVNCSLRPVGRQELGVKTEIKNLNTFKGVLHALEHEIERQAAVLRAGGRIAQETRRWDPDAGVTLAMRSKEDAHDYRYFPEPDLMPVTLADETVAAWAAELPERPADRRRRLVAEYGLPEYDAGVLVADRAVADFFERAARKADRPKAVSNWIMTEMLRLLAERRVSIAAARISPEALAELTNLVERRIVNSTTAKEVFSILFTEGGTPAELVERRGWGQVADTGQIAELVRRVFAEHARSVEDYRKGKTAAAKFLVGQVMRLSGGKADPREAARLVEARLHADG